MNEIIQNIEKLADLVIEKAKDKKPTIGKNFFEQIQGIKQEDFYLTEANIFRPIGYVYPDGDFENKFIKYYSDIEQELTDHETYISLLNTLQEKYPQNAIKNIISIPIENPKWFYATHLLSNFIKLLSRNIIHYSYLHNLSLEKPDELEKFLNNYNDAKGNIEEFYNSPMMKEWIKQEQYFIKQTRNLFIQKLTNKIQNNDSIENYTKNYKLFFSGIEIENDIYKVNEDIIMRKISATDKAKNTNQDISKSFSFYMNRATTIIETKKTTENIYEIDSYIKFIIESFQIFSKNLSNLDYEIIYIDDFISNYKNSCKKHENNFSQTVYDISNIQLSSYRKILELTKPLYENSDKELDFVKIAKDFYIEALNKKTPTSQITYACLCLEALFNTSEENVSNQLRSRCSILLKLLGLESKSSINDNIHKFYKIRSDYVHARNPKSAGWDLNFAQKALDYARFSLLMFLVLMNNTNILQMRNSIIKKDFINNKYTLKEFINEYLLYNARLSNEGQDIIEKCIGDINWIKMIDIEKAL